MNKISAMTKVRPRRPKGVSDEEYQRAVDLTDGIKLALQMRGRPKPRPIRRTGEHVLYRAFAGDGTLLYVGISITAAARFATHRGSSSWWSDIASITLQRFEDRDAVLSAERDAIRSERPLHNREHNK